MIKFLINTFTNGIFILFFVILPISLFVKLENIFFISLLLLALVGLSLPVIIQKQQNNIVVNLFNGFNSVVSIAKVYSPTPAISLLSELSNIGISIKNDIKSMILMTCSLKHGCKYYDNNLKGDFVNIDITMYGMGNKVKCSNNITQITTKKLLEHTNIIETRDNRFFVFYEPHHEAIEGKDILNKGAYLFELKDNQDKEDFKNKILEELNLKRV